MIAAIGAAALIGTLTANTRTLPSSTYWQTSTSVACGAECDLAVAGVPGKAVLVYGQLVRAYA